MIFREEQVDITTSSGAGSANTANLRGIIRQIRVIPASSDTEWTMAINDRNSRDIVPLTTETGVYNQQHALPIDGKYTVALSGASADEAFIILLNIQETYT